MTRRDAEGPIHRVSLPWPKRELSPNARVHHFVKARAVKAYRAGCAWEARAAGLRRIEADSLWVRITFHPPDARRRDRDNLIAAFKAGADGLADVLGVDDALWVPTYVVGTPVERGRVFFEAWGIPTREAGSLVRLPIRGVVR